MERKSPERYRSGHNGGASKASCLPKAGTWVRIPPSPPVYPISPQLVSWYAWQDSNLRPFAPEQSGLFTVLYMRSYSFQSFTSIQGACFRSKAEPVFLQLHKVGKSFATVVLRSEVRRHLPVRPPYESQHP